MTDPSSTPKSSEARLEAGTYEVIRNRLDQHGLALRERLEQLNAARKEVFGAIETRLLATERMTTEHNCVPRDILALGNQLLFGYNVQFGLKTETRPSDVFAVYEYSDWKFRKQELHLLADERFQEDFRELYRYYKKSIFVKFVVRGVFLYAVFRIGAGVSDIKSFKWRLEDERLTYLDNRSDHEVLFPPQHEFEWTRTHRDLHRHGEHPHISIEDRVFVETVGGDLTVKVEDNTESGSGIYAEPVENLDQTLDDAEVFYSCIESIVLLKIRPYQEQQFRYLVFNEKVQQVHRVDSIENSCVLLPDGHGLIFADGYYLQTGELKLFDNQLRNMMFERRVTSPNGEDYLYVFYHRRSGEYVLLSYNVIAQQVATPILCSGFTLAENGELLYFKSHEDPQKHHPIQIWQTPYMDVDFELPDESDSLLFRVGNRDLVRGMAECHDILSLLRKDDSYANLYVDIVKRCNDLLDSCYWIDEEEASQLGEVLREIRAAASSAVGEFDKVVTAKRETRQRVAAVETAARKLVSEVRSARFEEIASFVTALAQLRTIRGEIVGLGELRYVDTTLVEELEFLVAGQSDSCAERCLEFLLQPESLQPYRLEVAAYPEQIEALTTAQQGRDLGVEHEKTAAALEMLIEMVSNLKVDDATRRTEIIDRISEIFTSLNQVRAALKQKLKELGTAEGIAEFSAQLKLLQQSVINYLDLCDTPAKCDEFLTKLMVQLEELDGRFAEFDEFVEEIGEKRQEVYDAFEARKLALSEARSRRAGSLRKTAERILKGIDVRLEALESTNEINSYFASDLMVDKVRDLVNQLIEIDDTVKADEIQSSLKTLRENAVRQLKDRQDLFVDGQSVIRFGPHRFSVNSQPLDLSIVMHDGSLHFHLTGTDFFEPIRNEEFLETRAVWDQHVASESKDVYRGEFLAHDLFQDLADRGADAVSKFHERDEASRIEEVRDFMAPRYHDGYVKGVHDSDAAKILGALIEIDAAIGKLRFAPSVRALAQLAWRMQPEDAAKETLRAQLRGFAEVDAQFPENRLRADYEMRLVDLVTDWELGHQLFPDVDRISAARYLVAELLDGEQFVTSGTAAGICDALTKHLESTKSRKRFEQSVEELGDDLPRRFQLLRDWVLAFVGHLGDPDASNYADEVALLFAIDERGPLVEASSRRSLDGMLGDHRRVENGTYQLDFNRFWVRLSEYNEAVVPPFRAFERLKKELLAEERELLRLEEFQPRVLSSFVRSRLIDTVYLPLIGANLAKQIGVAGEEKRTDLMGLLLLISPPGYGKTTLMEYIAHRLGITFVKVNGPAIGHRVTSLDPADAPNSAAKQEIERLNLALEMGDNIMLYLDDIQHLGAEFLQKFISLCDAQRKIEGIYKGRPRTYDLRGRKVAVVMAGNPFTESGEKFRIPDMLANRADTYNLGDIIGDNADAFKLSYLENAMTSNPVLNRLATSSQDDVLAFIRMGEGAGTEAGDLEGNYSASEVDEIVTTLTKLVRIRDVVLTVNREYIRSAGQADEYRTEPAFKLQGSYRNMNKLAERVLPVMTAAEVETLILSHYESEAQTLTTESEANLLKLRELLGLLDTQEQQRWQEMKKTFARNLKLKGLGDDEKVGQLLVQLGEFADGIGSLRETVESGLGELTAAQSNGGGNGSDGADARSLAALEALVAELRESRDRTPSVNVVNRVPSSILNVVKQQFEVMQSWMGPLLATLRDRDGSLQQLRADLEQTQRDYQSFIQRLEAGEEFGAD
ncbi:MAG: DNA repair ATPase [Planctomycetota bacterium]